MDGKRQVGSSSSSFTAELFGIKESPASMSTGIFASMFPAPSVVIGRNSSSSKALEPWKKQPVENQTWSLNHRMQGKLASYPEGGAYNIPNKERNSIYQEERAEPCHLSSSLYYGGQDIYSHSPSSQTSASYPVFNKNEGEDDPIGNNSQGASRGNWWQGSLYY
ncbi:hypothetical protein SLE2022_282620 [Rubroshorea leprosula]